MRIFIYSRKSVYTGKGDSVENQIEMNEEEHQWLKTLLKELPSYEKYKKAKKHLLEKYIMAEMHEYCFTKRIYENIYKILDEDIVREVKRKRLKKEDFIAQMHDKFGNRILDCTNEEMKEVLNRAFDSAYQLNRVKKPPYSRSAEKTQVNSKNQ